MSGECRECSYSAWHRAGQMGRPFCNRLPSYQRRASHTNGMKVAHLVCLDEASHASDRKSAPEAGG
jgi:hypothetical protein